MDMRRDLRRDEAGLKAMRAFTRAGEATTATGTGAGTEAGAGVRSQRGVDDGDIRVRGRG